MSRLNLIWDCRHRGICPGMIGNNLDGSDQVAAQGLSSLMAVYRR